jgi:hypothetical protein
MKKHRINAIEEIMRPGRLSARGFLGLDEKLEDVLAGDSKTVKGLGITHKQLADRVEYFIRKSIQMLKDTYEINGNIPDNTANIEKYKVRVISWKGFQECPWCAHLRRYQYSSLDFMVTNKETGEKVTFPGLIVHLIRMHKFYEGKGTPYRLDPAKAARVLDIKPNFKYSIKTVEEKYWSGGSSTGSIDENFCGSQDIIRGAKRIIEIQNGAKGFMRGNNLVIVSPQEVQLKEPLFIDGKKVPIYENHIWRGQRIYHKSTRERVTN